MNADVKNTDALSRARIIAETSRNFFVEAGAGSGKTTMLVNRMVSMVENGADISKICAITFTRAAAGEFYKRFQKALCERSSREYEHRSAGTPGQLPPPTEETRSRCEEALKKIDLCFMGTIDSFCSMLLKEHPIEAGIPADAALMNDREINAFYRKEYARICGGEYGRRLQALAEVFQRENYQAADVFCAGMTFLMERRNAEFRFEPAEPAAAEDRFGAKLGALSALLETLAADPIRYQYTEYRQSVDAWDALPSAIAQLKRRRISRISELTRALKSIKNLRILWNDETRLRFEGEFFAAKGTRKHWLETVFAGKDGLVKRLEALQYDLNMTFLTACVPVLEEVLRGTGKLTYFDYLFYLRNMLKRDAEGKGDLIRYIYDRHSCFLIDEFQDTNPIQSEVFFYLCAEQPVPEWRDCVPRPGSLFIVGDPKQSIYRFRSADVTGFLRVRELFRGETGEVLKLTKNFRSTKTLCSEFNGIFTKLLPEETPIQSRFEKIPTEDTEPARGFTGIYSCAETVDDSGEPVPPEQETALLIKKLAGNGKFCIPDRETKKERPLRFGDFMVITHTKKTLRSYLNTFEAYGIPCRVEGGVPFEKNSALRAVCAVYGAVVDHRRSDMLYSALRSPYYRFNEAELTEYTLKCGRLALASSGEEVEPDGPACRVYAALQQLRELNRKAASLSPASLFRSIAEEPGIYRAALSDNMEMVYFVLERLRALEHSGELESHKDAAEYLSQLMAGSDGESNEERCLQLSENSDCVHLANLHKVKGLEAPVVILAYAKRRGAHRPAYRIEYSREGSSGWLFQLKKDRKTSYGSHFETAAFPDEEDLEKSALEAETDRQDYVAATRAMNALILCTGPQELKSGNRPVSRWMKLVNENDPPESIQAMLAGDPMAPPAVKDRVSASELYAAGAAECVLNDRSAEAPSYEIRLPSHAKAPSKLAEEPVSPADSRETEQKKPAAVTDAHGDPALLGTMTHKLMEILVSSRGRAEASAAVKEILSEFTDEATTHRAALEQALLQAADTILNGGYAQKNGTPGDILAELLSAEEVHCEVPFCCRVPEAGGEPVWNGIMDVVYKKEGRWHIVDYKTNLDGSDLDTKYRGQLQAYVKAFRVLTGETADAMTYHIAI